MTTQPATQHPPALVPDSLFPDPAAEARWRARFRAPRMSVPDWAIDAPDANLYVSNASGVWEIYAWDRATGEHHQVTDRPNGTLHATLSPDGTHIWWFDDTDGDEFGSWVRQPFQTGPKTGPRTGAERAVPDVPDGYPAGLEIGHRVTAVGVSTDDGSALYASAEGHTVRFYTHPDDASVAALSRDERLLAIAHSEHGDSRHPAVRVLATDGFTTVADKWDGEGKGLAALEFSPRHGDSRLLVQHERRGREELLVWDVAADTETELDLDLPGEVVATWYPDATALLVLHFHHGRSSLHRYELGTGTLTDLGTPPGRIGGAGARPDGTVEYSWSDAATPPVIRARATDGTDRVLLEPPGERAPGSVPLRDAFVEGQGGRIHALVSRPADAPAGPLPTVFTLHGGPHAADEDRFSAYRAVWVDAGFAVVEVNYRGSTGYGSAWRDAIEGRPGLTELEDVAAVYDWAVDSGLADPARCVVNGASWGGYLSLLALGTQPQRWAAGVAGVPVADYVAAYEDEMEQLRSFDRALFGGSPDDVPAVYRECSPVTYVDAVRSPVLVLAGDNDPRCPIRQIENYLDRLAARGVPYEFYRYDAGHGSLVIAETIKQTAIEVHFALRALGLR
ncbi:Dipeptidyl aminopeptidase/acylaminoacyl peptidase [Amycolatopsis arida]|uniref:Dipeptidyl aminopeptidase/acylaminoacyl peptidase n=1 Tax=Amycolatopsis arida TaxID=587909 RepID=A0A1I5S6W6_9PSEU|nr:prolyl oligopeptidase family serine peptidase [Amycolatopsis arida]TDX85301.1 dipeptidyl aminopeptidase/acylaminoacyl peptidase [Amycolatopsis arida]SFP66377.1 Dipeptidyl aminopeptidase/acylaminoacyl peptidase [Amycolatopsis arida]